MHELELIGIKISFISSMVEFHNAAMWDFLSLDFIHNRIACTMEINAIKQLRFELNTLFRRSYFNPSWGSVWDRL